MRCLIVVIFIFSFVACSDSKKEAQSTSKIEKTEIPKEKAPNIVELGDTQVIHDESSIKIDSVAVTEENGEHWFIGKKVDDVLLAKSNTKVTTTIGDKTFGPLVGYDKGSLKIGWNNQNRILFIEVLSPKVKTTDGLTLGSTKKEVLDALGIPFGEKKDQYLYQNVEFEVVGIIFDFDVNEKVIGIRLFSYV